MNLREIAKQAGVSTSTVSLVLNNRVGVGQRTRQRVSDMLAKNGYEISRGTQADRKNILFLKYSAHSHLVNGNPGFVNAIIDSVERQCRDIGYNLMMTVFGKVNIREIFDGIRTTPPDGIIMLATELEPEDLIYLEGINTPLVAVDNLLSLSDIHCVNMNNSDSIYQAVRHMVMLGYTRIGYLYNSLPSANCRARREAYETVLKHLGLPYDPADVFTVYPTILGAHASTLALLDQGVQFPPALLATNDSIAIGAMKAFKERGLRIPEDISIIGFDDIAYAAITEPPLTTMSVNCRDMGIWAVRLLSDCIEQKQLTIIKIQLTPTLVVRESTRAC